VVRAALPVLISAITTGLPTLVQLAGFLLALLAIGLISLPERATSPPKGLGLAVLAGCGFGWYITLFSRVSPGSLFLPLAAARVASLALMLIVIRLQPRQPPMLRERRVSPLVALAGVLDAVGNAFFMPATHRGRHAVAAILSSFYPAATVLLAAVVLRERVMRIQDAGILLALLAVPSISA
jgi:drug/metabolite transporter (DMT)-like permease